MVYQCVLPFCMWLFLSLTVSFACRNSWFCCSHISIFAFVACAFGVMPTKSLPRSMLWSSSLRFLKIPAIQWIWKTTKCGEGIIWNWWVLDGRSRKLTVKTISRCCWSSESHHFRLCSWKFLWNIDWLCLHASDPFCLALCPRTLTHVDTASLWLPDQLDLINRRSKVDG